MEILKRGPREVNVGDNNQVSPIKWKVEKAAEWYDTESHVIT